MAIQVDVPRPTIVLVHDAWADASGFDRQIRALQDRGFRAIGFGNPLRGHPGDAVYLAEFLRTLTGPIVLVGHSYGGMVISVAATGNEQVQALVFLNGWTLDEGESQLQLLERFEGSLVGPAIRPVPDTRSDGSQDADLYLDPEAFHDAFAGDVDGATAAALAAAQRPFANAAFTGPSGPPAWKTGTPCWYLLGTEDPAAGQVAVKQRVNAISLASLEDFRRDSDLFGDSVGRAETQRLIRTAMKLGLQARDAELDLAAMLGALSAPPRERRSELSAAAAAGSATAAARGESDG